MTTNISNPEFKVKLYRYLSTISAHRIWLQSPLEKTFFHSVIIVLIAFKDYARYLLQGLSKGRLRKAPSYARVWERVASAELLECVVDHLKI
jgi:hypothetical protein